jgi:hypothetical protein
MVTFKELPEELLPLSGICSDLEQEGSKLERDGAEAGNVKAIAARLRDFLDARSTITTTRAPSAPTERNNAMSDKFEDGSWAAATIASSDPGQAAVREVMRAGLADRDNNAPDPTPGPEAPAGGFGNTWAC